jgi:uncharacterized 2Fe-2S/4Fe-4S cluster protein (DUF4445 family)
MLALLSGRNYQLLLEPAHWMSTIDCLPDDPGSLSRSWGIHPQAIIEILPPLAGFVGSDLMAGVIATKLTETGPGNLLIDFGTNSEVALWDGKALWVTSAAGGPAFEGCGISCGTVAEPGAIYQVRDPAGKACGGAGTTGFTMAKNPSDPGGMTAARGILGSTFTFSTIEGENPTGICGSGIVDLIACLVGSGKLTRTGRFAPDLPQEEIVLLEGERRLVLTRKDVDIFQRAKGAISAAIGVLISMAGLRANELQRIYVGGAFGHFLNKANAVSIGLLPDMSYECIQLCGNTALAGCEYLLMSSASIEHLKRIAAGARLINLARSADFEDLFFEGLYLRKWPEKDR